MVHLLPQRLALRAPYHTTLTSKFHHHLFTLQLHYPLFLYVYALSLLCPYSVSYTHLDVYKRQPVQFKWRTKIFHYVETKPVDVSGTSIGLTVLKSQVFATYHLVPLTCTQYQ